VPLQLVQKTLPHLRPQVAAMVQLQLHSGMRPGEVVIMRTMDLDTSGKVWLYRPGSDQGPHGHHKMAWRGHHRIVALGPRAQEALRPWLRLDVTEFLFQPKEARETQDEQRRERRRSPMTPSQKARKRRTNPRRMPGERYTVAATSTCSSARLILRAWRPGPDSLTAARPRAPRSLRTSRTVGSTTIWWLKRTMANTCGAQ
jgi:integrase